MGYIQIVLAVISLAKEYVLYLKANKSKIKTAKEFTCAIKKARKEGNSDVIENVFGRDLSSGLPIEGDKNP